jgi:hypothetical protein
MVGRTLRYVAELDGEWVALICFSAAALHLKAREKWIGWTPRQRSRRLGFVVNNSRYLVLPERERLPNLASRALGLCLRRLSRDWEARWGQPVLAVETFVDETRYRGVCYRACGFEAVGLTVGFKRSSRDFYHEHGAPKQLYLKELQPGARALLRRGRWPAELAEHEERISGPCSLRAPELESLYDRFGKLRNGRIGHGLRHRQRFVLTCLAIDGKTLRGSGRTDGKPLQLLSCVTHRLRLTLAQLPLEDKSNEIPAFPKLLNDLPRIDHAVVTADAMHCQQESARVVTQELGWDYLFGLKGNQGGILDRAQRLLQKQAFPPG